MRVEGNSLSCPSKLVRVVDPRCLLVLDRCMRIPVTSFFTILYIYALCKYK